MITSWKLHRIIAGITQAELANQSQVALARIRQIERGVAKPDAKEIEALCRVLSSVCRESQPGGGVAA